VIRGYQSIHVPVSVYLSNCLLHEVNVFCILLNLRLGLCQLTTLGSSGADSGAGQGSDICADVECIRVLISWSKVQIGSMKSTHRIGGIVIVPQLIDQEAPHDYRSFTVFKAHAGDRLE
jgi:hypothetical protein